MYTIWPFDSQLFLENWRTETYSFMVEYIILDGSVLFQFEPTLCWTYGPFFQYFDPLYEIL